jgi:isopenicillin N synthase-like dioxygenase
MTDADLALPVLDLSRFNAGPDERLAFLREVREAARGPGFFYLIGHGIGEDLTRDVLALSRRFFALPEPDKLEIEMINSPHFRGYNRAGFEHTRGKPDWREQIDIGAEREALPFNPSAPAWTRLQGPNQWPRALPELRPTLLRYQSEVTKLTIRVLGVFATALEQPEDIFEPIYTPAPNQLVKIIRYPGRDVRSGDQGVGAHKDSGFVTILLQDDVKGLQVESEDGWIDAAARFIRCQHRRDTGIGIQRLFACQCTSGDLATAGMRSAVGRLLPRREARCDRARARSLARTGNTCAGINARSLQSSLS